MPGKNNKAREEDRDADMLGGGVITLGTMHELSLGVATGDSKPETDWSWEDQL